MKTSISFPYCNLILVAIPQREIRFWLRMLKLDKTYTKLKLPKKFEAQVHTMNLLLHFLRNGSEIILLQTWTEYKPLSP